MQENRSFDHYFGTLAGVRGFGDPNVLIQDNNLPTNGKSLFYQYDPENPDRVRLTEPEVRSAGRAPPSRARAACA
jgi:phospholipase C